MDEKYEEEIEKIKKLKISLSFAPKLSKLLKL